MPSLSVRRSGFFRRDYSVSDNANCLTTLNAGCESKSEFEFEASTYKMIRESCIGDFILSGPSDELCRGTKPSALFRSFSVVYLGDTFTLEARSPQVKVSN